ncbi:hypothetical protein [Nocardioides dongkuii]|uniref:hypothetical protein n=1 Tax=Nocardioides dongkuii TaxID=2760089 RepID=UPI0015F86860|nr:hypothetical protein [Nocardioides dongkuii]
MQLLALTTELTGLAIQHVGVLAADQAPEPEDVKAGWTAFVGFLLLIAALALLGWSLTKQLRRTEANRKAGVFGPVDDEVDRRADHHADDDVPPPSGQA